MKLLETAGRFVPGVGAIIELKRALDPEVAKRRAKRFGAGVFAVTAIGTGAYMSSSNEPNREIVTTLDGGEGKVTDVNRNLAEIHIVGYTSEIDGVRVEEREVNRRGWLNIPLPDLTREVITNDRKIDSSLCIAGGKKDLTEQVINGVTHVNYVIDPADISICSRESVDSVALAFEDGNWLTNMNDAGSEMGKMGKEAKDEMEAENARKATEQKSRMAQLSKNLALQTANRECGPIVFEATKTDALKRIEDTLGREGEVFTAEFSSGTEAAAIQGKSEVDAFFENLSKTQVEGVQLTYDVAKAGTCEISPTVTEGANKGAVEGGK